MRKSFWLALSAFLGAALCTPVHAESPAWQVLRGKSGAPFVRTTGTGNIATLSLSCSQGKSLMLLALRRNPARNPARLVLTVGDRALQVLILRTANPSIWGSVLPDGRVPDLLAGGQQARLTIDGADYGYVPLDGAREAMRGALAECWIGAAAVQAARPLPQAQVGIAASGTAIPSDPKRLNAVDRAAIMRAAGYIRRGKAWLTCEGMAPGDIDEMRDLNGDGRPEAIVMSSGTDCYGMTGAAFQIATLDPPGTAGAVAGTWRLLVQATGIPAFYPRPGIAWPDIEIGGPGFRCFPFLRWNGRAYVGAGTSLQGKICTRDPAAKR